MWENDTRTNGGTRLKTTDLEHGKDVIIAAIGQASGQGLPTLLQHLAEGIDLMARQDMGTREHPGLCVPMAPKGLKGYMCRASAMSLLTSLAPLSGSGLCDAVTMTPTVATGRGGGRPA